MPHPSSTRNQHSSVVSTSWFLTTKRHSSDVQPSYIPIFSLFFEALYPVGVTEVRLCFMHKIAYNSFSVDQIYLKIDSGKCLYAPNTHSEFQPDWSMHTWFLQSVQSDKEEKLEFFTKLCWLIYWKRLERFCSKLEWGLPAWRLTPL